MDLVKQIRNNRLITYITVGGTAYVLEMACIYVLRNVVGLSGVNSVAISFWVGLVIAFFLQKLLTFKNRHFGLKHLLKQSIGYSVLVAWNYCFSLILVIFLQRYISVFIIRTLAILCITLWNYKLYHILFRHEKNQN